MIVSGNKEITVSYWEYFWSEKYQTFDLNSVFEEIKNEKHIEKSQKLSELYNSGKKDEYTNFKKKLPVVAFCGVFENGRKKENLIQYNRIIVIDIDKLGNEELQRVKTILLNDPIVNSFWESPSRDGIKGIVYLNFNFDYAKVGIDPSHKLAFRKLTTYFKDNYNIELDISGSDFTRLCFICHDININIKNEIVTFNIDYEEEEIIKPTIKIERKINQNRTSKTVNTNKNILNNPFGKNNQQNKKTILNIIKFLSINNKSITYTYDNWLKVAFAITSSFTFDIGIKYFQNLCKIDKEKYNEKECETFLIDCYNISKGNISFSTIIYLAKEQGFIMNALNVKSS